MKIPCVSSLFRQAIPTFHAADSGFNPEGKEAGLAFRPATALRGGVNPLLLLFVFLPLAFSGAPRSAAEAGGASVAAQAATPHSPWAERNASSSESNPSSGQDAARKRRKLGLLPQVSQLSCSSASETGAASDSCTVTLSAAPLLVSETVQLMSSNSAVTVPSSVSVPAGSTSANFTAAAAAVTTTQTATLTASAGGASKTFAIQLNAWIPALTLSASSINFGSVVVNTSSTLYVKLTSSGTAPLTISSGSVTGTGFTISGVAFPVTLNPGQSATLSVIFDPARAGSNSGTVTLSSNAHAGNTSTIGLSGTGLVVVRALSCSSATETGAASDGCTVTLNAAAPSGGVSVGLASSNSAVTVPSTVVVPAGATSAGFTASVSAVSSAQTATLTATTGGVSKAYSIQLNPAGVPTLRVSAASIAFGDVSENTTATQSLTLTSSGGAALTISSIAISGAGFSKSGVSTPITLNPNQTATLEVQFDPTTAGSASGAIAISSNSSTGGTTTIGLSGTGTSPTAYQVDLSWDAPTGSSVTISGYNIYRAVGGSSSYQKINPSLDAQTAYTDTTVSNGDSYNYYVESVSSSGGSSVPSNTLNISVP